MIVKLSGFAKGNTNVILAQVGSDAGEFDAEKLPVDFFTLKTYGNFIYSFTMPKAAAAGKYGIYLKDNSDTVKTSFIYYDGTEADNLILLLKEITDLQEYKDFIRTNAAKNNWKNQ